MITSLTRACAGFGWFLLVYGRDGGGPRTGRPTAAMPARPGIRRSRRSTATTSGELRRPGASTPHEKGDTQTQPIVVGRVLFAYTPTHKTIALDAASGKLLWSFDPGIAGTGANRGLMYWSEGADARVFAAVDNFVYALDAATGKVIAGFGQQGRIDLRENLGRDPASAVRAANYPGRRLPRPDDRRRPRGREPAGLSRPHPRLRRAQRRVALDFPHHSGSPASPATTPGRRMPGSTSAAPTAGRA